MIPLARTAPTGPVLLPFLVVLLAAVACDRPGAYGDANALIVATTPQIWEELGDSLQTALEPEILTVTRERAFRVTYQDPEDQFWGQLKHFRQVVVVGDREKPWVEEALERLDDEEVPDPPGIVQVPNVWAARGQLVTVVLLPPGAGAEAAIPLLDELQALIDERYRGYARDRMFLTGRDSALLDTLRAEAGFSLLVPQVYEVIRVDSAWVFRNDNPDPAELIRQVTVAWRSPVPDTVTADEVLQWRLELSERYAAGQDSAFAQLNNTTASRQAWRDPEGSPRYLEVQAAWTNPPDADWPAGGPFISRAYLCPGQDRLYLADAWLYAPGEDKYEYMLQLETILDSFGCGG